MEIFHGTHEATLPDIETGGDSIFDGLFFSCLESVASSHAPNVFSIEMPEDMIASSFDLGQADAECIRAVLRDETGEDDSDLIDELYDAVIDDVGFDGAQVFVGRILTRSFVEPSGDSGDVAWELQRLRGRLAAALGYAAVECDDEHGTSYLVVRLP